jgi:hypothetical protein
VRLRRRERRLPAQGVQPERGSGDDEDGNYCNQKVFLHLMASFFWVLEIR